MLLVLPIVVQSFNLPKDEITAYEATGSVYTECFECGNSFYLEDDGN